MKSALRGIVDKTLLLIVICISFSYTSQSQHIMLGNDKKFSVEAGLNFGPTFFLGDLGGNKGVGTYFLKDINLDLTKMMKGAFVTVYPNSWMGLRFAGQLTKLSGNDQEIALRNSDEGWRKERNLDFRTNVWEAYGALELYPLSYLNRYDEEYDPTFKPYAFAGVGVFNFNPEGSLTDGAGNTRWYKLHPLRTEGQGMAEYPESKPYKLTQLNVPFGAGVKIKINSRFYTGTEILYRHTFTDYIDDVSTTYIDPNHFNNYLSLADATIATQISDKMIPIYTTWLTTNRYAPGTQRGNPKRNDDYFSCVLKVGVKLGNQDPYSVRQTRCPHFY